MGELINNKRLASLDALRGFDMFWIIGADVFFKQWAKVSGGPVLGLMSENLTHVSWNGFSLYDLIFPLFLFLAGVSTPFSVGRQLEKGKDRKELLLKVVRRSLTLVLLGVIYNNGLKLQPIEQMRLGSVLGRIGLAYMFANIIYLYAGKHWRAFWTVSILVGYRMLLGFFAAPGFSAGDMTLEGNVVSYIDRILMPGKLLVGGIHDPEGLISTVPAIATGLMGIYTGEWLRSEKIDGNKKALGMVVAGLVLLGVAQAWNLFFPINKNLWTSSFTLQCAGLSLLLMAVFYYVIDVKGFTKWAFFFRVIGMNSILIYMSGIFINWSYATRSMFQWLAQLGGEQYGAVILAGAAIMVRWLFLYFLYRKKIFLSV
ncbi:DUF5009 domain-containing protein (plasmid) [Fulvitalea axinellae]|uniref:DUF5009 domain-containing protein n=1 Tax=Fulvitalea axinellae TaxID=1182444 RepID=A0AAU9CU34_9BACT|nr:DUF5009 domain-containing protein [Fulvitalea axinellae]